MQSLRANLEQNQYPHFLTLLVCRVLMRAIGSVCRMSYICPKSSGLKVFVQQFTKTLRSSKIQDSQTGNRSLGLVVWQCSLWRPAKFEHVTFLNFWLGIHPILSILSSRFLGKNDRTHLGRCLDCRSTRPWGIFWPKNWSVELVELVEFWVWGFPRGERTCRFGGSGWSKIDESRVGTFCQKIFAYFF